MKKLVYTIALIFVSQIILAQTTTTYTSFSIPVSSKSRSTGGGVVSHNTGGVVTSMHGSPYLNEYFLPGSIELSSGEIIENVRLRLNTHQGIMEIDNDGEILEINKPDLVRRVELNDRVFIYNPYFVPNAKSKNDYFEVLVEGPLSLYSKRTNDLKMESHGSHYSNTGIGASYFKTEFQFFVKTSDEEVFELTKKRFLGNITSHKSEIKNYIKKRRTKFNDELDLKKLIQYYNSLN